MLTKKLTFRDAKPSDLEILTFWDQQAHVIACDPNDDWDWESELTRHPDWRKQWISELSGKPFGFIQIIDPALEETQYWGKIDSGFRAIDIWIGEESYLGQGLGQQMMMHTIDFCFTDSAVHTLLVDPLASNIKAHRFYQKCGFRFKEERRFGLDLCYIYSLKRNKQRC